MSINQVNNQGLPGQLGLGGAQNTPAGGVSSTEFMSLLTTQLQNQNPLAPLGDAEFLSQLAQFSQLEETQAQRRSMDQMSSIMQASTAMQGLSQAGGLIGKSVSWTDPSLGTELSGEVTSVQFGSNGVVLEVGGQSVPLGSVTGIASLAQATPPVTDPTDTTTGQNQ